MSGSIPPPLPAAPSAKATVSVSALLTGHVACDRRQIVEGVPSEKVDIPVLAFLIEKDDKWYTFDLGLRPDLDGVPKHVQDIEYDDFKPTAQYTFPDAFPGGVNPTTVFLSHYHWDHVGNPGLLPRGTRLVYGKGSLGVIGSGYPDGDPWYDSAWLDHCAFTETEFDSGPIGDFPAGKDWFGDGSFWLIDCPGHCVGNMIALARVTTSPDTYVLLGGDGCHDQALYTHPCQHSIAHFTSHQGDLVSLHEDHAAARENFVRLNRMSQRENVMVVLAHEREALGIIPMLGPNGANTGALDRWKQEGWKEQKYARLAR